MITTDLYTLSSMRNNPNLSNKLQNVLDMNVKDEELNTINYFLKYLLKNSDGCFRTDGIVYDFCIPGFSIEFDILKNTKDFLLNIELKSGKKTHEEMIKQVKQHYYYLNKVKSNVYCYIYNAELNELYYYKNDSLETVHDIYSLLQLLNVHSDTSIDIDDLISANKFLISPFNDVNAFMNDQYILSSSQKQKQKLILNNKNILLLGKAGTGKTLLVYDLVKKYIKSNKNVCIIHGANKNGGQRELNCKYGFNIYGIRQFNDILELIKQEPNKFDIIVLDEVQRFRIKQIDEIIKCFNGKVILSGDPKQILTDNSEFGNHINSDTKQSGYSKNNNLKLIKLSTKIRTNKSMSQFILGLMNKNESVKKNKIKAKDISFAYFDSDKDALNYIKSLEKCKSSSHILSLPSTLYGTDLYTDFYRFDSSFQVIGQEFDDVSLIIGSNIGYNKNGKLVSEQTYYNSALSLFQNITRVRKHLNLIIIKNSIILNRVLDLLNS